MFVLVPQEFSILFEIKHRFREAFAERYHALGVVVPRIAEFAVVGRKGGGVRHRPNYRQLRGAKPIALVRTPCRRFGYPCRSLESATKLAERFIAGVTKPTRPAAPAEPQPSTLNPQPSTLSPQPPQRPKPLPCTPGNFLCSRTAKDSAPTRFPSLSAASPDDKEGHAAHFDIILNSFRKSLNTSNDFIRGVYSMAQ